ncbi:ORF10 [Ostreid herpesvirus 1]|nr:ORF10 [Ostreid herpesvirus 1]
MQSYTELVKLTEALMGARTSGIVKSSEHNCKICRSVIPLDDKNKIISILMAIKENVQLEMPEDIADVKLLDFLLFWKGKIEYSTVINELFNAHKGYFHHCYMVDIIAKRYARKLYKPESLEENKEWLALATKAGFMADSFFRKNNLYDLLHELTGKDVRPMIADDNLEKLTNMSASSESEIINNLIPMQLPQILALFEQILQKGAPKVVIEADGCVKVNHCIFETKTADNKVLIKIGMPIEYEHYNSFQSSYYGNGICRGSKHKMNVNVGRIYRAVKAVAPQVTFNFYSMKEETCQEVCGCVEKQCEIAKCAVEGIPFIPKELRAIPIFKITRRGSMDMDIM